MPTPTSYAGLVDGIIRLINIIIPGIFAVLFIYLIWKVVDAWVINAGDEKKREEGRKYITAAIIVFVIMVSAWGIVAMIRQSIFGF